MLNHPLLKFGIIRKGSGGKILAAEIRCDGFGFQVVNIYAFTSSYPKQKKGFFNQIYDFINVNSTLILIRDFNCVENPTLDRFPSKTTIISESKQLTELVQLCKMFDCYIKLQPQNRKHTFFSENSSSRIDRIYATDDVNTTSERVSPNQFSDHDTLIVQFDITLQPSRGRGYWKNNVTYYQNEAFSQDFENKWQTWKKTQESLSIVEWWITVKNKIKKLVIKHSIRLKQENLAFENNLKHQLDQLANSQNFKPNSKLFSVIERKLTKLLYQNFKKKLIKNEELFQYSRSFSKKEFFRQFIQKREKVTINELIDYYGLPTTKPAELVKHVERFYAELYRCDQTDLAKQNLFLDNIIA